MSTIKTLFKIESQDALSSPFALTVTTLNNIGMDVSFSSEVIPPDGTVSIYGPTVEGVGASNTVYLYVKASNTNNNYIRLSINDGENTSIVMKIAAGDYTWFPLAVFRSGVEIIVHNNSQTADSSLDFFFAVKG
jgi:hypothetical protein